MSQPLDTFWYTRCAVPNSFGVAMHHGWIEQRFAEDGVSIRSIKEADSDAVRESHFDHTLANSVRYGGSSPALWARSSGSNTRLLGLLVTRSNQLIVARPDSGVERVEDLKGRRFGLPLWENQKIDFQRAQALRGLENALATVGLTTDDVEIVDYVVSCRYAGEKVHRIPGTEIFGSRRLPGSYGELRGLIRGEVDAIFLHGALGLQRAHDLQLVPIIDLKDHPDPLVRANNGSPVTLAVDQAFLDEQPALATALLEQILRAEDWGAAHPGDVRRIAAGEVNVSEYWLSKSYGGDEGLALRTTLDDDAVAALQSFADFLLRRGFIPEPVDVSTWLDAGPLERARASLASGRGEPGRIAVPEPAL
jgi:ABC-type nitrate/sulfonate/bicarbonate transport system substrate-binding protein